MITKENVTLFICEFCRKAYQKKHFCTQHEQFCHKNPNNNHACFGCGYLEKTTKQIFERQAYNGDDIYRDITTFHCNKLDKIVYSYAAEKIRLPGGGCHEDVDNGERMPLECIDFKSEFHDDFDLL